MFKNINEVAERFCGDMPYEKVLKNSNNIRIKKMLSFVSFLRFILFPVYTTMFIVGSLINLVILILGAFNFCLELVYNNLLNSHWLRLSWFDVTPEEIIEEYRVLKQPVIINEAS